MQLSLPLPACEGKHWCDTWCTLVPCWPRSCHSSTSSYIWGICIPQSTSSFPDTGSGLHLWVEPGHKQTSHHFSVTEGCDDVFAFLGQPYRWQHFAKFVQSHLNLSVCKCSWHLSLTAVNVMVDLFFSSLKWNCLCNSNINMSITEDNLDICFKRTRYWKKKNGVFCWKILQ